MLKTLLSMEEIQPFLVKFLPASQLGVSAGYSKRALAVE
jgi:hypothetical protein